MPHPHHRQPTHISGSKQNKSTLPPSPKVFCAKMCVRITVINLTSLAC